MTMRNVLSHISQEASRPLTAGGDVHASSALCERPTRLPPLVVWFALLSGLGEVSFLVVKKFFLHQFINVHTPVSQDIIWMAPLANLFIFAIPGFVLFLVQRRWPRVVSPFIAAFVFAYLGLLSLLLMCFWLHPLAAVLLAAGLAVQAARIIAEHPHGFQALVQRTLGWMVALIVLLAVAVHGWQALTERRLLAKLPPAASDAPNVVLIVLDTVRAQNLSVYGYRKPTTPQLARFAKTGVVFERAIATAPWTLPSHGSMFTGHLPYELSTAWYIPLDATYPTLAEVLSAHGYATAGFVANIYYCSYESGLQRGFAHYEDYSISPGQIMLSSSLIRTITRGQGFHHFIGYYQVDVNRKTAEDVNREFLAWLSHNDRRPFFAFLNYFDAHVPYLSREPFDVKFGSRDCGETRPCSQDGIDDRLISMAAYDGAIAYLDHHLGLLFDELEKRGVLENTLVIITSDHGEQFGEHGLFEHGNSLYLPLLHVPLLISFPSRVPAAMNVRDPVSLRDIPATVVDLLKLEDKAGFSGTSLARYWDGARHASRPNGGMLLSEVNFRPKQPEWLPVSKGDMKSLIVDRYHYIRNGDGYEELYDFENDPLEKHNLVNAEEGRRALTRFRKLLGVAQQREDSPRQEETARSQ